MNSNGGSLRMISKINALLTFSILLTIEFWVYVAPSTDYYKNLIRIRASEEAGATFL